MKKEYLEWEKEFELDDKKSDNAGLVNFLNRIASNWYWFLLCTILGGVAAMVHLRYSIPTYKVHAKLLVSDEKKGGGMLSSSLGDLSGLMGVKSSVDNEVEILRTADLMYEMVEAEEGYINYFKPGNVRDAPLLEPALRVHL